MYSRQYVVILLLVLTGATAAAHGWALWDGLFLDDHWHRRQLEDDAWSLHALLEATTIKPDRFINMWWQQESIQWQYVRPFAILVSKVVYHLTDGSVKAWHAISVLLHLAAAFMVHHLCLRLTHRRFWSVVGALLFVVYSHSVYAVAWLAAQNSVLMTTLMLGALLCYIQASGLNLYAGAPGRRYPPDTSGKGLIEGVGIPALRCSSFLAAMLLWALAIGSRENAVVLPALAAAFDLAFGGWRHVRARWRAYVLMIVLVAAFASWRLAYFYHPMPDFYLRRPDGPSYLLWCIAKLMHYLTAAVWLSPMMFGPTLRFNPMAEVPGDCLLMLVILAVLGTGYYLACRRARGYWIWPMWILLAVLPVVPVMATPHSGYLPGVGFAVAMVIGPALRHEIRPLSVGRWSPGVALWFLVATTTYMPMYRAMWYSILAAERLTIERVAASPPPHEATDLFFINLPFVNVYAQLHLAEVWEHGGPADARGPGPGFRCHVLTYASNVLRMEQRCRLQQLDARSFSLSIVEGRPYFSGAMGRFLVESMRAGERFRAGQRIRGDLFDVRIVRADEEGVPEMVFEFQEPLASSKYCFYVTTSDCAAARVRFRGPDEPPGAESFAGPILCTEDADRENLAALRRTRDVLFRIREIAAGIIRTDLYLTGPPFPGPR